MTRWHTCSLPTPNQHRGEAVEGYKRALAWFGLAILLGVSTAVGVALWLSR